MAAGAWLRAGGRWDGRARGEGGKRALASPPHRRRIADRRPARGSLGCAPHGASPSRRGQASSVCPCSSSLLADRSREGSGNPPVSIGSCETETISTSNIQNNSNHLLASPWRIVSRTAHPTPRREGASYIARAYTRKHQRERAEWLPRSVDERQDVFALVLAVALSICPARPPPQPRPTIVFTRARGDVSADGGRGGFFYRCVLCIHLPAAYVPISPQISTNRSPHSGADTRWTSSRRD